MQIFVGHRILDIQLIFVPDIQQDNLLLYMQKIFKNFFSFISKEGKNLKSNNKVEKILI